jgi:hypothetical protein
VVLRVTDTLGGSSTQRFEVTVRPANVLPVVISLPPVGHGRELYATVPRRATPTATD